VPPSAYEAYVRGEILLAQGDTRAAARELALAATFADDDIYLLGRLATAQDAAGERAAAEATLALAEARAPCHPALWEARGALHSSHNELSLAAEAHRHGLDCAPDSVDARLRLVRSLEALGREAEAMALLPAPSLTEPADLGLVRALHQADAAALAFAFEGWLSRGRVEAGTLLLGVERALSLGAHGLAARLLAHVRVDLPLALRARVALEAGQTSALRELLASTPVVGDSLTTAELALAVGDGERAVDEAGAALREAPSDRARAALARGHALLGSADAALTAASSVEQSEARGALSRELLDRFVSPGLARELKRP
jgi:predicted Zn-dependent protease